MVEMLLLGLRYFLTLLFGVAVSAAFLDVAPIRRNIIILCVFAALDFAVQGALYLGINSARMFSLYPFVTHIPLMLLLILAFKARPISAILSVLTGYLCCQVSNWASTIPQTFQCADWIVNLTYIAVLIGMFPLVFRFAAAPIAKLLTKPSSALLSFAIVPVLYYIFDYVSTVYTKLLYAGNYITVEFPPFLLCVSPDFLYDLFQAVRGKTGGGKPASFYQAETGAVRKGNGRHPAKRAGYRAAAPRYAPFSQHDFRVHRKRGNGQGAGIHPRDHRISRQNGPEEIFH